MHHTTSEGRAADVGTWRDPAILALAGLGIAISAYLTWVHYSGGLALCAGAGGCEQVQASRFATVAGLPVALLGLALYLGIFGLGLWRARSAPADLPDLVPLGQFGLALAGVLYSGYLTYLELYVIGAVCPWCVASAIVVTAICALTAWNLGSP
ncbi:MAG: vitamin K epoxide reductase family protein [Chloroflexi bacterium]|nr:vitamin K epoxide reductase family protein [Chloroflexota bacterium]